MVVTRKQRLSREFESLQFNASIYHFFHFDSFCSFFSFYEMIHFFEKIWLHFRVLCARVYQIKVNLENGMFVCVMSSHIISILCWIDSYNLFVIARRYRFYQGKIILNRWWWTSGAPRCSGRTTTGLDDTQKRRNRLN